MQFEPVLIHDSAAGSVSKTQCVSATDQDIQKGKQETLDHHRSHNHITKQTAENNEQK